MTYFSVSKSRLAFLAVAMAALFDRVHPLKIIPGLPNSAFIREGNISVGILLSVHQFSAELLCSGGIKGLQILQQIEAIDLIFRELNENRESNFSFGYVAYDDCNKDVTALAQSLRFIAEQDRCTSDEPSLPNANESAPMETHQVSALICCPSSAATIQVANLLSSLKLAQLSYSATAQSLTDPIKYETFSRVIPPDRQQARVIGKILNYYNWTFVSAVYSQSQYGEEGLKMLRQVLVDSKICLAESLEVRQNASNSDYRAIIISLLLNPNASVVVLYLGETEGRRLLAAARQMIVEGRITWIVSDAFVRVLADLVGLEEVARPMISLRIATNPLEKLHSYLSSTPIAQFRNPWVDEFARAYYDCSTTQQTCGDLKVTSHSLYEEDTISPLMHDAIHAFVRAVDRILNGTCGLSEFNCLVKALPGELRKVSFEGTSGPVKFTSEGYVDRAFSILSLFNNSGQWALNEIGIADEDNLNLWHDPEWTRSLPSSTCGPTCGIGEEEVIQAQVCCWICELCPDDCIVQMYSYTGRLRCVRCKFGTWPNENRLVCENLVPQYPDVSTPIGIVLAILSIGGMITALIIAVIWLLRWNTPLVKASSRELSCIMLFGTLLSYGFIFSLLAKPSTPVCLTRMMAVMLSCTICYGPLVTKCIRIYRIVKTGAGKLYFVSTRSQLIIANFVIIFHALIIAFLLFLEMPYSTEKMTSPGVLELVCVFPNFVFILSSVLNLLLLLSAAFCAFKCRKLPENFAESRFISFCVFGNIMTWLVFLTAFVAVDRAADRVLFLSLLLFSSASLVQGCIFWPKVYAIYCLTEPSDRRSIMGKVSFPDKPASGLGACDASYRKPSCSVVAGPVRTFLEVPETGVEAPAEGRCTTQ